MQSYVNSNLHVSTLYNYPRKIQPHGILHREFANRKDMKKTYTRTGPANPFWDSKPELFSDGGRQYPKTTLASNPKRD